MALREIIARFGFQVDQGGLRKAQTGITGVIGSFRTFGAVIAGSAIVRGVSSFVTDITKAGDELGKTATQLGLSGKELQAWQTAAGFAGVEANNLNQGFRILGKNALLAQQGSKQAGEAFKSLGVDIESANGQLKPANQLAREAGVALGAMEDRTKAVGLAQQVFGRAGAALLPLFKDGEEGLDRALAKLEEFGGGLSDQLIPLAEESRDRFFEFELATTSLKSQVAVALLPVLNQITLGLSKVIAWVSRVTEGTSVFKSIIVSLGLAVAQVSLAKFGGSLLKLGRAALVPLLKFALLFLIVDDLMALFEGRESVIGSFMDKLFGAGSSKQFVNGVNEMIDALKKGDFEGALESAVNGLSTMGRKILEATDKVPGLSTALFGLFGITPKVVEDFITAGPKIVAATKGWLSGLLGLEGSFKNAADKLGQAIIEGIVGALEGGAVMIARVLTGNVLGGVKTAKKALKAQSPSRLAAEELGEPLSQGVAMGAMNAARAASRLTANALVAASALRGPQSITAPARGGVGGGMGLSRAGGVVFKSDIALTVSGGSATDPQIQKLRQGVRSELRDNRRATLDALTQRVEAPA